jgi:hypothetical protein
MIFSKCFILTSWLEIGNKKKIQLQLYLNIQILIQFSNTLKLDWQKGISIILNLRP